MAKFRTRLEPLMKDRGLTRMDIVRQVEVSYPTVMAWQNDAIDSISADLVFRLMRVLGLDSIDELIYFEPEEAD